MMHNTYISCIVAAILSLCYALCIPFDSIMKIMSNKKLISFDIRLLVGPQSHQESFDCDFHVDSGSATIEDNHYCCSACGVKFDGPMYLSQRDNLSLSESVALISRMQKSKIPTEVLPELKEKLKLFKINQTVSDLLREHLQKDNKWAAAARDYVYKSRDLRSDVVEQAGLGFFPGSRQFIDSLVQSFGAELLENLGLITKSTKEKGYFSLFSNRLMFPIKNKYGQICAFGGRKLEGNRAKYINSPNSQIFQKRNSLYTVPSPTVEIVKKETAVVVEGYMDVISGTQRADKFDYFAGLGTALNPGQIRETLRSYDKVIICKDGDKAGVTSSLEFIKSHNSVIDNNRVSYIALPDNMDPDEFLRIRGQDAFYSTLESALSAKEFVASHALRSASQNSIDDLVEAEALDSFGIHP